MLRPEPLVNDQLYHVMNKSIAGYRIFNSAADYQRMMHLLRFFQADASLPKFSQFLQSAFVVNHGFEVALKEISGAAKPRVQIVAYCLMPSHVHLVLKQCQSGGAAVFMADILNSYARYFNTKRKRHGPLWVGRFKNVGVGTDEQLLHLTRYLHLNPVTAGLVTTPEEWKYSSYSEYVQPSAVVFPLCDYKELLTIDAAEYRDFVTSHAVHQRELAVIKKLALE